MEIKTIFDFNQENKVIGIKIYNESSDEEIDLDLVDSLGMNYNYWGKISLRKDLSEYFIDKYSDKLYWYFICVYTKMSELFMNRHLSKLNWDNICFYQDISLSFIKSNINKVNPFILKIKHKIDDDFISENFDKNWKDEFSYPMYLK